MNTIFRSFTLGIALLLFASAAESEPLPLGATLDVHSISVARALPPSERAGIVRMTSRPEGTTVTLLVEVPDFSIIELDQGASRLTKFIDDKGNDLLKPIPRDDVPVQVVQAVPFEPTPTAHVPTIVTSESTGVLFPIAQDGLPPPTSVLPTFHAPIAASTAPIAQIDLLPTITPIGMIKTDEELEEMRRTMMMETRYLAPPSLRTYMLDDTARRWILIDCVAPNRPAPGTQIVTLEGELVLYGGQEIKTTEHKNIPLDGTGTFEINGMTVTVNKVERGPQFGDGFIEMLSGMFGGERQEVKMRVSLTSSERPRSAISYTLLDANGNKINTPNRSWATAQVHTEFFDLTEEVDSLTIRLKAYEKMETITLPFSLNVGLGL